MPDDGFDWLDELNEHAVAAGPPHRRMGTRTVDVNDWLRVDGRRADELRQRRLLVDERPAEVHLAQPGTDRASAQVAQVVHDWLRRHAPATLDDWDETVPDPLVRAGLAIQEDLCVLHRADDGWRLVAGFVCFPTYWCLADKLGKPPAAVHAPVPHYAEELGPRVDQFLDALVFDRIVARRNWGFTPHPVLHLPDLDALEHPAAVETDQLWLRSERQTLRRLEGTGTVVFTIRVQLAPATAIASRPALARRLAGSMRTWTPEMTRSRGHRASWLQGVEKWLARLG